VESVEIRWSNGRNVTLQNPAMNRYHAITATK
jgi:hypothetical protein